MRTDALGLAAAVITLPIAKEALQYQKGQTQTDQYQAQPGCCIEIKTAVHLQINAEGKGLKTQHADCAEVGQDMQHDHRQSRGDGRS